MDVLYFFNQAPINRHLDSFQSIMNSAAKNNFIHMLFCASIPLGKLPKEELLHQRMFMFL